MTLSLSSSNEPALSVVLTTIGRPTLLATLESLRQLGPADELLLITDGEHPEAWSMLESARLQCHIQRIVHRPAANDWGHTLRNLYSCRATRERVLHMDDDDVYLEGALSLVRQECAKNPHKLVIFQTLGQGMRVPGEHRVSIGNIDTKCGALPNRPELWGRWQPYYGGDGAFYQSCRFELVWCDLPIAALKPHEWDAPQAAKTFVRPVYRAHEMGQIPRIFHRIWLGRQPMPDEFRRYGDSWLELNPGWGMHLWTDNQLPEIINRAEFDQFAKLAGKADVLRFEILWRLGGVYLDTDFEALRPLDHLGDINAFFADEGPNRPAIGIIGSVPGDPFYRHLIQALPKSVAEHPEHVEKAGPPFFARELTIFFGADRLIRNLGRLWEHTSRDCLRHIYGFETKYFYPYGYWEPNRRKERFPCAYGVHHWAHSWR